MVPRRRRAEAGALSAAGVRLMLSPAPGHTLAELLLAIAVLAILACLAALPFAGLLDRLRADQLRMQLHTALNQARSTALTHRRSVLACPSSDGLQCGQDWSQGWLLRAEQPRPDEADPAPPLAARQLQSHSSLQAFSTHGRPHIVFRASGRSAGSNARIRVCQRGLTQAEVVVSNTGRVRSLRSASPEPC
ncbi:hypothetical protein C1930_07450 [Stenotrophomonas sp. SAU14A_NAIMI4_8]|nr:hypothetical protein C1930_07450 [Stenotrophomonas sp. SAU14A_NAIMI4_8]